MANKDAFCQPPGSSEQTSAFLKHLLLVAPNKFMYNKIIYRVCFSTICEHVFIYIIRWSPISGETISQGLQEKINKRVFPFYSPNCWTNTLKAWNLFKVYIPTGARSCYHTDKVSAGFRHVVSPFSNPVWLSLPVWVPDFVLQRKAPNRISTFPPRVDWIRWQ